MRRTLAALVLAASLLSAPVAFADEGGSYARPITPVTVQDEGGSYAQPNAPAEGVWDYEFVVPQTVPSVLEEDSGAD